MYCVNALSRANPISTASFWEPHKQGFLEAISAGNSQNILKNRIFRGVFSFRSIFQTIYCNNVTTQSLT